MPEKNNEFEEIDPHGFKVKHVGFIAGTMAVLIGLLFFQHPLGFTDIKTSLSLHPNLDLTAWYSASPQAPQHGAVLGAQTYDSSILKKFSSIKFQTINDNSAAAIQNYSDQLNAAFQADQAFDLSSDHVLKFLTDVQQLAVPTGMQNYHRLLLGYLEVQNGQILGSSNDPNLGAETQAALQVERNNVEATYTIHNLP